MSETFSELADELGEQPRGQERTRESERQIASQEWMDDLRRAIEQRVREKPYQMILGAAGVGYVLGGGIPTWVLRAVVHTGSRALLARALGPALGAALEATESDENLNMEQS